MGLRYSEIPKWISDRGISDALHTQMSMQKVVKPPQNEGFKAKNWVLYGVFTTLYANLFSNTFYLQYVDWHLVVEN